MVISTHSCSALCSCIEKDSQWIRGWSALGKWASGGEVGVGFENGQKVLVLIENSN